MTIIPTENNLFETIQGIFQMQQRKQANISLHDLNHFFQEHEFYSYDIGIKDQINLKLLCNSFLENSEISFWESYQKLLNIQKGLQAFNLETGRKYEVLIRYLFNLLGEFNTLVFYNGYLRIAEGIDNFPKNLEKQNQFFLQIKDLPHEALCGCSTYFNPILKCVFEASERDPYFLLFYAMCEEICDTKEEIRNYCFQHLSASSELHFKSLKRSLWKLLDQDFPYILLYYEQYYNVCVQLFRRKNKKDERKKRNRVLTIPDYEYFEDLIP